MFPYEDIVHLPHPDPKNHPRMPRPSRAAQFAPFAALVGYDDAVQEAARFTEERTEVDVSVVAELNEKLHTLSEHISEQPEVCVRYFRPDNRKNGGEYVWVSGKALRVDPIGGVLVLKDRTAIPLQDITDLTGPAEPN